MVKRCFSAVRAGGANNSEGSARNITAEVGETDGVSPVFMWALLYLTGDFFMFVSDMRAIQTI
jgi:hypothetical protein